LPLEAFVEFFKYFGFGIDNDNEFISTVKSLFNIKKLFQHESEERSSAAASRKSKPKDNLEIKIHTNHFKKQQTEDVKSIRKESNAESIYKNPTNENLNLNLKTPNSVNTKQKLQKQFLSANNEDSNNIINHDNNNNINNISHSKNNDNNFLIKKKNNINNFNYESESKMTLNVYEKRPKTAQSETRSENNNNKNNNNLNFEENAALAITEKLKSNLKSFGRKSLLSLIKHFKCYDNGTKFLTKPDFMKVIRDFRLNLTTSEIEKLFDFYVTDKKKLLINFEEFINLICLGLNETRRILLLKTFADLTSIGKDFQNLDIELLKSVYNPKANIFGADAEQIYTEFVDCVELYHFNYKKKRNNSIALDEFLEFYRYIGFLIEEDEQFVKLIETEFEKVKEIKAKMDVENALQREQQQERLKKSAEEQEKNSSENNINKRQKTNLNTKAYVQGKEENENANNNKNNLSKHSNSHYEVKDNNDENEHDNYSCYSNESKMRSRKQQSKTNNKNENAGTTAEVLQHKLENLLIINKSNLNNNNNKNIENGNDFRSKLDNKDVDRVVPDNRSEIDREAMQTNFNRSNKFTKEMKEKAVKSDGGSFVNYVVNKNFKCNLERVDAPQILNVNNNNNYIENKGNYLYMLIYFF